MIRLCFATNNQHKLSEVKAAAQGTFEIISLEELSVLEELPETQDTLEGNALQKALFVFNKTSVPCFADDSGLEVNALHGAPGVFSARYAGPQRNSSDNIKKLLTALAPDSDRRAQFRTVIALVGFGEPQLFEGIVEGSITKAPRGAAGFGYDPIFQPSGYSTTFAEMTLDEKNKLSHRARAVSKLVGYLISQKPG
jgi:XTP/dITP diphosphohydrolase